APQHDYPAVRRGKVFLRVHGNGALTDLGFIVAGVLLMLLFSKFVPEFSSLARTHFAQFALFAYPACHVDAEMRIVNGQDPPDGFDATPAPEAGVGDDAQRGYGGFTDAAKYAVVRQASD